MQKNRTQGYCFLLLAQLMVGVCIVSSKALLGSMTPVMILSIRFVIGFVLLLVCHFVFSRGKTQSLKKLTRTDWWFIVAQALCAGALFNILLLIGLKHTSASMAGIITSTLPAMVAVFSIIFLKERLTFFTSLCIGFAVLGLIIMNLHSFHWGDAHQMVGGMVILISLLPEAAYYVLSKIHANKLPVFLISALMNGINIPIFLFLLLLQHDAMPVGLSVLHLVLLLVLGVGSALFYVFWFLGCKSVQGSAAGLSTAFMPIATLLIAWLFLNESIAWLQVLGMLLVIVSIVFNVRGSNKVPKKRSST